MRRIFRGTRAQLRSVHRVRLRQRRDRCRYMHTHVEGVRQDPGLSRLRGRGTRGVRRERVFDQQRRLFAGLRGSASHVPLRLQSRLQADQQQHVRRSVYWFVAAGRLVMSRSLRSATIHADRKPLKRTGKFVNPPVYNI